MAALDQRNNKKKSMSVYFKAASFRVQTKLGPRPDWSLFRVSFTPNKEFQIRATTSWYPFIHFYQRTRLGEEIKREYDDPVKQSRDEYQDPNTVARKPTAFSKHIHAVILVLKANDPRLEEGIYRGTLQWIRNHFQTRGNDDHNQ